MDNTTLETRRFFKKFSIQLLKNCVHIIKATPFESSEFDISYDQIETKKTVDTKISYGLLLLIFFLMLMGTLFLLGNTSEISPAFFLAALLVLIIAMATKLKVVTIRSYEGHLIELYFTNKNKEDVLAFADAIILSANAYLLNKFSKIDKDMPIENQLTNLDFLREKELITEEMFEQLKNQLLGRDLKKSIGYR